MSESIHTQTQKLLEAAQPLFSGQDPEVARAVLVSLCAMWFGSFIDPENRKAAIAEWGEHILEQAAQMEAWARTSRN